MNSKTHTTARLNTGLDDKQRERAVRILGNRPNKKLVLIAELALVLASVFVFRGLWMLLDAVEFMHAPLALWLSLILGSAVTVWALRCLMKQEGK